MITKKLGNKLSNRKTVRPIDGFQTYHNHQAKVWHEDKGCEAFSEAPTLFSPYT